MLAFSKRAKEIADIYKKLREAEAKLIGPDGKDGNPAKQHLFIFAPFAC